MPTRRPPAISLRLEREHRRKLEALAEAEHRSLTNYVMKVLLEHLEGVEKAGAAPARKR
jgi:uncharacterized protein (DUF1778 family)